MEKSIARNDDILGLPISLIASISTPNFRLYGDICILIYHENGLKSHYPTKINKHIYIYMLFQGFSKANTDVIAKNLEVSKSHISFIKINILYKKFFFVLKTICEYHCIFILCS